jgi:hypothetical protein
MRAPPCSARGNPRPRLQQRLQLRRCLQLSLLGPRIAELQDALQQPVAGTAKTRHTRGTAAQDEQRDWYSATHSHAVCTDMVHATCTIQRRVPATHLLDQEGARLTVHALCASSHEMSCRQRMTRHPHNHYAVADLMHAGHFHGADISTRFSVWQRLPPAPTFALPRPHAGNNATVTLNTRSFSSYVRPIDQLI